MVSAEIPIAGNQIWDAVIIGAGSAGSATAITLARQGLHVLVAEKSSVQNFTIGESLPPAAMGLVRCFLGCDERLHSHFNHFTTAGNISSWGREQPDMASFFFSPAGHGLCVDRNAFDEALRAQAVAAGATVLNAVRFCGAERTVAEKPLWRISFGNDAKIWQTQARFLVDCSGRPAVVARALRNPIVYLGDHLFACARFFVSAGSDDDCYTRIESSSDGWWYSSRLPTSSHRHSKRLVVFYSDKDICVSANAVSQKGFGQLLSYTKHIGPLLESKNYSPIGVVRGAPAHSQRLKQFCGEGWMAVGDAAQAYDPLSSQGIYKALQSATDAGHLISYILKDNQAKSALSGKKNVRLQYYAQQQTQLWHLYTEQWSHYYNTQTRWSDQPFWVRRRKAMNEAVF